MWDVFISHASEDKAAVAVPLADELRNHCLSVWLDMWVLSPGDSLRRKIDEGISRSRLGVVVLSHAFFAKTWPQAELDALYTLSGSGKRSVVPVWHEITADEVSDYSPLLAASLALPTSRGIEPIAEEIARKLGPIGRPLTVDVGLQPLAVVPDLDALATAIRQSEDVPGSYAKRRVMVSFHECATPHEQEIRQGVRLLITHEPLTFPVRTSNLLAMCVDSFIRIYDELVAQGDWVSGWTSGGRRTPLGILESTSRRWKRHTSVASSVSEALWTFAAASQTTCWI